jgi:quercetin dioxygenase-like cupin family protein
MTARRVVTSQAEGRGIIASDQEVPPTAIGEAAVYELWRANAAGCAAALDEGWALDPPAGGHVFRISVFPPAAPGEQPWMHRTGTIDYALILEGELTLVMDEQETVLRPGDIVVQQGANHGWINRGDRPARMAVVLIDAGGATE